MNLRPAQYLLPFLLACCAGCITGRSLPEPDTRPGWVNSRPVMPGYYTGTGWARKTGNVQQYQQAAKKNALADLASEISVTISLNSVLHAFESNLGFREDFSSTIQARTQEELEGFEVAGVWEDQENYWIYYRLSAARHQEIKEKKKHDAIARSVGFFEDAIENRDNGNHRRQLVQLINSMGAISNYMDEPLPVDFRGKTIQLGNALFNELYAGISGLRIHPATPVIEVKRGQEITGDQLRFSVKCPLGGPVAGFPLVAGYSERPVRNNRTRTDSEGTATFSIDRVRSMRNSETFIVTADMEGILAEATSDPVLRRMIRAFPVPEAVINVSVRPPVLRVEGSERIMDQQLPEGALSVMFLNKAVEAGYRISNNEDDADYVVVINANAGLAGQRGNYINASLRGNISVRSTCGTILYQRELTGFSGTHFDMERAGQEAYREAARRLDNSFFREIDEVLTGTAIL